MCVPKKQSHNGPRVMRGAEVTHCEPHGFHGGRRRADFETRLRSGGSVQEFFQSPPSAGFKTTPGLVDVKTTSPREVKKNRRLQRDRQEGCFDDQVRCATWTWKGSNDG